MDLSVPAITSFRGEEHRFLSNFYRVYITFDGEQYPTLEHAYQASKTLDREERSKIRNCKTPGAAKDAGQLVKKRHNWESLKYSIMRDLLLKKFDPVHQPALYERLLATHPADLIEGNEHGDTYWGVCNGEGQNHLGKLLVQIREDFLKQKK